MYRGETVEVLEEQSPIQWQVKNKFGGIGIIPAQVVELVVRKKKSEELHMLLLYKSQCLVTNLPKSEGKEGLSVQKEGWNFKLRAEYSNKQSQLSLYQPSYFKSRGF